MTQPTWLILLGSGNLLGPNGEGVDCRLDAIQFGSFENATEVSALYPQSKVIEARIPDASDKPEATRLLPSFAEMWPH